MHEYTVDLLVDGRLLMHRSLVIIRAREHYWSVYVQYVQAWPSLATGSCMNVRVRTRTYPIESPRGSHSRLLLELPGGAVEQGG